MSEIKALEELREYVNTNWTCQAASWARLNEAIDNIEAEIAERYMELPVDADGAPIRVGDKLFFDKNYPGICTGYDWLKINDDGKWMIVVRSDWHNGGCRLLAHDSAHHVQRTLEDVLRDVWKEALDYAKSDIWRNPDEVFAERADEIRAMFGEVDDD